MKLTAGQAAKAVGKSVPTISRAIHNGKLSADKTGSGGYLIEASELFRVFPPVTPVRPDETPALGHETPNETRPLQVEVEVLRERLRVLEAERERERGQFSGQVADLREDRDKWREQAERATRLLAAPAAPPVPAAPVDAERPSLLSRLFGAMKR